MIFKVSGSSGNPDHSLYTVLPVQLTGGIKGIRLLMATCQIQ